MELILIPLIVVSRRIAMAKISAIRVYKRGDKRQPCRTPLLSEKSSVKCPLTLTQLWISVYKIRIHWIKRSLKWKAVMTLKRKSQSTWSKALSWSRLMKAAGRCCSSDSWMRSRRRRPLVVMDLPGTEHVWSGSIIVPRTLARRRDSILDKIL